MPTRSYHQYCPIAHALDLVGERWTLLILRDLLLGPKRFSDLLGGLPGIGTNILTDRLKGLEQGGLVQRRVLPPPAASTVYELTPFGRSVEAPLMGLAQWGGQSLGESHPEQTISRDSVLLTARALGGALFQGHADKLADAHAPASYVLHLRDARFSEVIRLRRVAGQVEAGQVEVVTGETGDGDLALTLDVDTLFALAGGHLALGDAVRQGRVELHGPPAQVARILNPAQADTQAPT